MTMVGKRREWLEKDCAEETGGRCTKVGESATKYLNSWRGDDKVASRCASQSSVLVSGQRAAGGQRTRRRWWISCRSTSDMRLELARAECGKVQQKSCFDVSSTFTSGKAPLFVSPLSPGDATGDQSTGEFQEWCVLRDPQSVKRGRGSRGAKTPMPASRPVHLARPCRQSRIWGYET